MTQGSEKGRIVVVSNRIPTDAQPSGGLVVALHEALEARGGVWIGSSGELAEKPGGLREIARGAYRRLAYDMTRDEHEGFYLGHANSVLWPLFHHRADLIDVDDGNRRIYREVNARVAAMIAEVVRPSDLIWIHDYHFLPLAHELRKRGIGNRIGFFLHIPFPNPSDIAALPDRKQLAPWIAAYDLVGLQTQRDVSACLEWLRTDTDAEFTLRGRMKLGERFFEVRSFPIGIDVEAFRQAADEADISIADLPASQKLVLGVDRLDYSKGLPNRFEAFGKYLELRDSDAPRATMLQIAPPSREDVEAYQDIRTELETMAGRVNGEHALIDWTPIRYLRKPLPREVLAGLYRRADLCLVTPLADGMNLVAKEYVAAQDGENPGVLVLSHFAGAAEQLEGALLVNPYDTAEMAQTIDKALTMSLHERRARWLSMMQVIRDTDIGWWTESYLRALRSALAAQVA